jgi:hypothetical protein
MTVTAQRGFLAYAPQNFKSTHNDYDAPTAWYRHKAYNISLGTVEDNRQFPLEVGGVIVPTGAFKAGSFFGGAVQITPRLEDDFGWLLYAALGTASSSETAESGVFKHVFKYGADDTVLPWMEFVKYVPGATEALIERGVDCKITSLAFTVPQSGIVQAELGIVGRVPSLEEDPTVDGSYGSFENSESVPISPKGSIQVDSEDMPATGAVISIANNLTSPQQEMIIGEYHPDDFVPLSRQVEVRFTHKWPDADLYQKILTGTASGETWSPAPFYADVEIVSESPANIPGKNQPYKMRFYAQRVAWRADGPPELRGGDIIQQNYVGIVNEPESGDYAVVEVWNEATSYIWPT